ncbi:lipocalin family protein [Chryseobacterium sp.]|uniref:lipocalin family protein n=1 Tax=Chryseobacterium sp. TaxID=1871047 RepID=UPI0028A1D1B0|nr:lipocalin family protein [Chryseobacterium sp.]
MKFLIGLIAIMGIVSCSSDDDRSNTKVDEVSINGTWKPSRYEFKGKSYPVSTCEKKGQIHINADFSGVYDRYDTDAATGNCVKPEGYSGKWVYDRMYGKLTLTYTEAGASKTLQKSVDDFSSTELKIADATKNVDGIAGNDDAVLVYIKE